MHAAGSYETHKYFVFALDHDSHSGRIDRRLDGRWMDMAEMQLGSLHLSLHWQQAEQIKNKTQNMP